MGAYCDEVRTRFCHNLANARRQSGLTQEALAERVGFSLQYVQRVEWGKHRVPLDTMARLAFAMDLDCVDLLKM